MSDGYDWVDDPDLDLEQSLTRLDALEPAQVVDEETDMTENEFDKRAAVGEPVLVAGVGAVHTWHCQHVQISGASGRPTVSCGCKMQPAPVSGPAASITWTKRWAA